MNAPLSSSTPSADRPGILDVLLLGGLLAAMLWGLGSYGLYEPHEGHFAGVGREMVLRGDWVVPHLNGAPYLNKPPLLYWMIATSYSVFGVHEYAARLPLALAAWAGVVLAWQWGRELFGLRAGRAAALMLAATAGWYLFSHQLLIDVLLSTLYFAALYCLWKALSAPERPGWWIGFHVALALSVMAKGPVGLFPLLVLFAYCWACRDWGVLRRSRPLAGALAFAVLVLPWLVLIERRVPGFLSYVLGNETLKRALDQRWPPDYDVVKVSAPVFVAVALIWLAPWSLVLAQTVSYGWKQHREATEPVRRDALFVLGIGALLPTLIYLPIPARLIYYCLPTVPPFVLLCAGWWMSSAGDCYPRGRAWAAGALLFLSGVLLAGGWLNPFPLASVPDLQVVPAVLAYVPRLMLILGVALLAGGVGLLVRRPGWALAGMGAVLIYAQVANVAGFAAFDPNRSSKRMVAALDGRLGRDCLWVSEGSKEIGSPAGTSYYLGQDSSGQARWVYVMADDPRRPPPAFPKPYPDYRPPYLLDQQGLVELWRGTTPVVFVTDFARTDWSVQPLRLPWGDLHLLPVDGAGHRRVYANTAAWRRWQASEGSAKPQN